MTEPRIITRRAVLTVGGAGAAAVALAACTPGTNSAGTATDSPAPSTPAPTGPATTAPSSGEPAADAPSGTEVAKLSAIPVGGSIDATLGSDPIVLAQPEAGTVVGFSAICTHQQCVVAAAATEYDCPCHQSRFDATTGEPLAGSKALTGLAKLTVTVSGDAVLVTV
jgi:Rieske Fe-S protein